MKKLLSPIEKVILQKSPPPHPGPRRCRYLHLFVFYSNVSDIFFIL